MSAPSNPQTTLGEKIKRLAYLQHLKRYQEVVDKANEALEENPDTAALHYCAALGLLALGEIRQAEERIGIALKLDPLTAEYYGLASRIAAYLKQWDRRDHLLQEALRLAPEDLEYLKTRCTHLLLRKRWTEANDILKRMSQIDADSADTHFAYGFRARLWDDPAQTVLHFQKIVGKGEADDLLQHDLAGQLHRLGREQEAIAVLYSALQAAPDNRGWQMQLLRWVDDYVHDHPNPFSNHIDLPQGVLNFYEQNRHNLRVWQGRRDLTDYLYTAWLLVVIVGAFTVAFLLA